MWNLKELSHKKTIDPVIYNLMFHISAQRNLYLGEGEQRMRQAWAGTRPCASKGFTLSISQQPTKSTSSPFHMWENWPNWDSEPGLKFRCVQLQSPRYWCVSSAGWRNQVWPRNQECLQRRKRDRSMPEPGSSHPLNKNRCTIWRQNLLSFQKDWNAQMQQAL